MDKRRLTIALVVLGAGLLFFLFYMNLDVERRRAAEEPPGPVQTPADTEQVAERPEEQPTPPAEEEQPAEPPTPPQPEQPEPPQPEPDVQDEDPADPEPDPREPAEPGWLHQVEPRTEPFHIGSQDPRTGYNLELELTPQGAALHTAKLSRYFATVKDKQLWERSPDEYEQRRREEPDRYQGRYRLMEPVEHEGVRHLPYQTGRLTVESDELPDANIDLSQLNWAGRKVNDNDHEDSQSVEFTYTLGYGTPAEHEPMLRLVKTYTVRKQDYSLELSLRAENLSGRPLQVTVEQHGPTGVPREDYRTDMRHGAVGRWSDEDQAVNVNLYQHGDLQNIDLDTNLIDRGNADDSQIIWVGTVNQFFGSMMYMQPTEGEGPGGTRPAARYRISPAYEAPGERTFVNALTVPRISLGDAESKQLDFKVFAGPKSRGMFVDSGADYHKPIYRDLNYVSTITFGRCCTWAELSLAMMWLLQRLSGITMGNYGLAIILLVILVRLVLHPLTRKGQVSMHKMQKLGPQMQRLKEKYADDKEALNREMMNLYKKAGASPFLGCLPMLLQMPIWIALFTGLSASVELRHAGLLPFWLTDLAAPDALITWSQEHAIPWLGWHQFSLLPVLMAVAMALQSKFNPQMAAQASASPEQAKQQKMMKYMFPAVFFFIFYQMPSGLNLYIMTSTFVGVAEQYFIRKHLKEKEAEEAAHETTVKMPGKAPRSKRPKKPKGPFWTKQG